MAGPEPSKEEQYALMESYLGFGPRKVAEDIYRAGEDFIGDACDALEKELNLLAESVSSKDARPRIRSTPARHGAGSSSASSAAAGPTDSVISEEIAKGLDRLWTLLLAPYASTGDMFEVYSMKNIFAWPSGVSFMKPAATAAGSSKLYTAASEAAADERIGRLEAAIKAERRRKRTLVHIKQLFEKRLPQAEDAWATLEAIATDLKADGAWPASVPVQEFLLKAQRLKSLCDRLAAAAPSDVAEEMRAASQQQQLQQQQDLDGGDGEAVQMQMEGAGYPPSTASAAAGSGAATVTDAAAGSGSANGVATGAAAGAGASSSSTASITSILQKYEESKGMLVSGSVPSAAAAQGLPGLSIGGGS